MTHEAQVFSKDELTSAKVVEIFKQAFMDASIDSDGDVAINMEGLRLFAILDPQKGMMRLLGIFQFKPQAHRQQTLDFCNRVNEQLIMVRASTPTPAPNRLLLDHYVVTDVGLTGEEIVDETRRFRTVVVSALQLDNDGVLQ